VSNALLERRLREFVDRDQELAAFIRMLDSDEKHIMVVWGESGMGKTSLLMRMIHECSARKLSKAEVVWKDSDPHNYLAVMRKIREDVGVEHFPAFTDLVNFYHEANYQPKLEVTLAPQSAAVSVAQGMVVNGSKVGDVAAVVIKDCMISIPRTDLAVPESERRSRLTRRFIEDLKSVLAKQPLVVFFDAAEKMSAETEKWVWEGLLDAVRNGVLTNVKFVQCGQRPPPDDRDWLFLITQAGLKPLGRDDIAAYLKKRVSDLDDASLNNLTAMILGVTKGNPANVASNVDAFLQMRSSQAHGGE
jgi:hypothetical protein